MTRLGVLATLTIAGCATGISDGVTGSDHSDASAPAALEASADGAARGDGAAPADGRADAASGDACTCGGGGCGACPTVVVITIDGFAIDSIEVTNAQFAAFLASGPAPAGLPSCAAPLPEAGTWPAGAKGAEPAVGVTWCDAHAYCRWAGKRLCGAIGGGAAEYADPANAARSEWFDACTGHGAKAYPYGATYDGGRCNGADFGNRAALPAGSAPDCVGGVPGLFDMSGNVWEWEDSCAGAGPSDACRIRGGSFANSGPSLACATDATLARDTRGPGVGFRCCSR